MVQLLSIIFFLDFFNFCWVFQKFPFFLCHSVKRRLISALECLTDQVANTAYGTVGKTLFMK